MRPVSVRVNRGWTNRRGLNAPLGSVLRARNSRFLPGDPERLWALLGRAKFNQVQIPTSGAASPPQDAGTVKSLYYFQDEDGTDKLIVLSGGSFFEADLVGAAEFTAEEAVAGDGLTVVRSNFIGYKRRVYYPTTIIRDGTGEPDALRRQMIVREPAGWLSAGFVEPTDQFTLSEVNPGGGGGYSSSTAVRFTYRYYSPDIDMESQHGPIVEIPAFTDCDAIRLTFPSGTGVLTDRSQFIRIYKTLNDEEPGLYYRCDGSDNGIPVPLANGATIDINTDNRDAQIYGLVRSDGEEGTINWAEHGGEIPPSQGATVYQDHLVLYGIEGFEDGIMYSAKGYMEGIPVAWDGSYQYYLQFASPKQDRVIAARPVNGLLCVWGQVGIWRVTHLPTYAQPGFDRIIRDQLQAEHGICGRWAVDTFGIGETEAAYAIYVSREHGPMLTNAIWTRALLAKVDWSLLADPSKMDQVKVTNYPAREETWIYFTPKGGTENSQAIIVDYSLVQDAGIDALRMTGPVDVRCVDAVFATGEDKTQRLYVVDPDRYVYVQDSGSIDEQQNTNPAGDIAIEWWLPRFFPSGRNRSVKVGRAMVDAICGFYTRFDVTQFVLEGIKEYSYDEIVRVGYGDGVHSFMVNQGGQAFRTTLAYTGPSGSNYDEEDAQCAPGLRLIEYELHAAGRRTEP